MIVNAKTLQGIAKKPMIVNAKNFPRAAEARFARRGRTSGVNAVADERPPA